MCVCVRMCVSVCVPLPDILIAEKINLMTDLPIVCIYVCLLRSHLEKNLCSMCVGLIMKKLSKISLPNQTTKIWHILADILWLGAYFSKPISALRSWVWGDLVKIVQCISAWHPSVAFDPFYFIQIFRLQPQR